MKKSVSIIAGGIILILLASLFLFKSCIIQNPKPEECEIKNIKVTDIKEGGVKDIVFYTNSDESYYINRGLELGLNLDSLKTKVLNKTVTLHLAEVLGGITTKHISQMTLEDEIIYTEFE